MFTFLPLPRIRELMEEHNQNASKRPAHHALASEFVEIIHGRKEAEAAAAQHQAIFNPKSAPSEVDSLSPQNSEQPSTAFHTPSPHLTLPRSLVVGQFFHKVIWSAGLAPTKAEAFRLIVKGGAHVGSMADSAQQMGDAISYVPIKTWPANATEKFIVDESLMIIKIGRWKVKIIKIVPDEEYEKMGESAPGWKEAETKEDRKGDADLVKSRQKLKGRRVKLPMSMQAPKPAIVHLRPSGPWNPDSESAEPNDEETQSKKPR